MKEEPDYHIIRSRANGYFNDRLFITKISLSESNRVIGKFRADKSQERFKQCMKIINESDNCLIWVSRNIEQKAFKDELGNNAKVIEGSTPIEKRVEIIDGFRNGDFKYLISKPSILGFE
jgi:superfamily II DNA or RNA helicase